MAAWQRLLDDEDVRRWHDKLANSSPLTADERVRVLARYCAEISTTPAELVKRASDQDGGRKRARDQLQDFVTASRNAGRAPGYVANFSKAVKSWLEHNDILLGKITIGGNGATPTIEDEKVPTPEELRRVLTASTLRGRVIVTFVAFAGVRPGVLGNEKAKDGLRIRDLPDLRIEDRDVRILRTPMQVTVRREISKIGQRYFTFLPAEGCGYLREYLEHRIAAGEVLDAAAPVVRPDYHYTDRGRPAQMKGSPFLGRQGISDEIRTALRSQGLRVRPYVLRSYADTALLSGERPGKITQTDREFFMGRKGTIDRVYTVGKVLPAEKVDEMRRAFAACEPYFGARPDVRVTFDPEQLVQDEDFMRRLRDATVDVLFKDNPKWLAKMKAILAKSDALDE